MSNKKWERSSDNIYNKMDSILKKDQHKKTKQNKNMPERQTQKVMNSRIIEEDS